MMKNVLNVLVLGSLLGASSAVAGSLRDADEYAKAASRGQPAPEHVKSAFEIMGAKGVFSETPPPRTIPAAPPPPPSVAPPAVGGRPVLRGAPSQEGSARNDLLAEIRRRGAERGATTGITPTDHPSTPGATVRSTVTPNGPQFVPQANQLARRSLGADFQEAERGREIKAQQATIRQQLLALTDNRAIRRAIPQEQIAQNAGDLFYSLVADTGFSDQKKRNAAFAFSQIFASIDNQYKPAFVDLVLNLIAKPEFRGFNLTQQDNSKMSPQALVQDLTNRQENLQRSTNLNGKRVGDLEPDARRKYEQEITELRAIEHILNKILGSRYISY